MPKFYTQYDKTPRIIKHIEGPSMTDPTYGKECDIGFMIENYKVNRIPLPQVNVQYGHSPKVDDFLTAQQLAADVKSQFELLPAKERDIFKTVENYLAFVGNPANLRECYERGLIDPSSVDLKDVYPEKYKNSVNVDLPVEKPQTDVSQETESVNANS